MKKLNTVFCLLLFIGAVNAQQASEYFPAQTGFDWKFKATPLDSAQIPIPSLAEFRVDSFASVTNYEGKLANIVLTKTGPLQTIQSQPFLDSLFYYTEGTIGFEYFNINNIKPFLIQLDSSGLVSNFSFLDFFTSLQDWYSIYRFTSNVNTEYTLLQMDSTITIGTINAYLRFKYFAKRLQDETIQTVLGSYNCKKFLQQWKIIYYIVPPIIGIDLFTTNDTIWIAPGNWIVQDIIPANNVDLSLLGLPAITIYGLETKLTDEIVSVIENEETIPSAFSLEQNYPNPFNPTTNIGFRIADRGFVSLKVFDVLGNEIATLVNEEKSAGRYEIEFNASSLPSGIYFYKLTAGSFIETKKMLLLK
jgi:Secretion system C-terminal sorting domain